MHTLSVPEARRLALARAGLLKPEWTGLPRTANRGERAQRDAALSVIRRFGYLQLDTVSIAGARSHALVLLSRLPGFRAPLGERLLAPGEPLFEFWGHEASWIPMELYPAFAWRRRRYRHHPWWGDILGAYPEMHRTLLKRLRTEGPLMSSDLEGASQGGWWDHKPAKKVAEALWSRGDIVVRERRDFRRVYDLPHRVLPEAMRGTRLSTGKAVRQLLLTALDGFGWARTGTLSRTWRFTGMQAEVKQAMARLREEGDVVACAVVTAEGKRHPGWIRPRDLDLAERLRALRPRTDRGVLLSPFDPLLWDRTRVATLFGFDQVLEIFKPASQRTYGYFCLPVLAGDRLVARVDLKADRAEGRLRVLSHRLEPVVDPARPARHREAVRHALTRHARSVGLELPPGELPG